MTQKMARIAAKIYKSTYKKRRISFCVTFQTCWLISILINKSLNHVKINIITVVDQHVHIVA